MPDGNCDDPGSGSPAEQEPKTEPCPANGPRSPPLSPARGEPEQEPDAAQSPPLGPQKSGPAVSGADRVPKNDGADVKKESCRRVAASEEGLDVATSRRSVRKDERMKLQDDDDDYGDGDDDSKMNDPTTCRDAKDKKGALVDEQLVDPQDEDRELNRRQQPGLDEEGPELCSAMSDCCELSGAVSSRIIANCVIKGPSYLSKTSSAAVAKEEDPAAFFAKEDEENEKTKPQGPAPRGPGFEGPNAAAEHASSAQSQGAEKQLALRKKNSVAHSVASLQQSEASTAAFGQGSHTTGMNVKVAEQRGGSPSSGGGATACSGGAQCPPFPGPSARRSGASVESLFGCRSGSLRSESLATFMGDNYNTVHRAASPLHDSRTSGSDPALFNNNQYVVNKNNTNYNMNNNSSSAAVDGEFKNPHFQENYGKFSLRENATEDFNSQQEEEGPSAGEVGYSQQLKNLAAHKMTRKESVAVPLVIPCDPGAGPSPPADSDIGEGPPKGSPALDASAPRPKDFGECRGETDIHGTVLEMSEPLPGSVPLPGTFLPSGAIADVARISSLGASGAFTKTRETPEKTAATNVISDRKREPERQPFPSVLETRSPPREEATTKVGAPVSNHDDDITRSSRTAPQNIAPDAKSSLRGGPEAPPLFPRPLPLSVDDPCAGAGAPGWGFGPPNGAQLSSVVPTAASTGSPAAEKDKDDAPPGRWGVPASNDAVPTLLSDESGMGPDASRSYFSEKNFEDDTNFFRHKQDESQAVSRDQFARPDFFSYNIIVKLNIFKYHQSAV